MSFDRFAEGSLSERIAHHSAEHRLIRYFMNRKFDLSIFSVCCLSHTTSKIIIADLIVSLFWKNLKLKLDGCWINFQKKYDFQPMHDHAGVYSFIIFYDIPYDIEEEKAASPCVQGGDARVNGHLEFHYVDYKGRICTMSIPADKNWHGRLIIFPADLKHSVNPFYSSDEYRITISGNLAFEYQE